MSLKIQIWNWRHNAFFGYLLPIPHCGKLRAPEILNIKRISGFERGIINDVSILNTHTFRHTWQGPGSYWVSCGGCGGITLEKMMKVSMRELLEAGAHFGHRTCYWNPEMAGYIFGSRNKIHIINLEKTIPLLSDAYNYAGRLASNGAKILFVGTKRSAREIIKEQAKRCGMPYVDHRWLGGMLTNFKTVRQSIFRLKELKEMFEKGLFNSMIKKEALLLTREMEKLDRALGGIENMNGLPDALFVIDVGYENIAVEEAHRLRIPVIGVVDTNHSPQKIDYIIPGNDDSMRAVEIYVRTIADAILDGKNSRGTGGVSETEYVEEVIIDKDAEKAEE